MRDIESPLSKFHVEQESIHGTLIQLERGSEYPSVRVPIGLVILDQYYTIMAIAQEPGIDDPSTSSEVAGNNSDRPHIQLPKIQLPKFDAYTVRWIAFRDIYKSLVHDNGSLSNVEKYHYLLSAVSGNAGAVLRFVVGFQLRGNMEGTKRKCRRPTFNYELPLGQVAQFSPITFVITGRFKTVSRHLSREYRRAQRFPNTGSRRVFCCFTSRHACWIPILNVCLSHNTLRPRVPTQKLFELGHNASECSSKHLCRHCSAKHHSMIHFDTNKSNETGSSGSSLSTSSSSSSPKSSPDSTSSVFVGTAISSNLTILRTACFRIRSQCGQWISCRELVDSGSQVSAITHQCASTLELPRRQAPSRSLDCRKCQCQRLKE
ncbi:Protein of unknown function DUF1759 [Cinara cedri]|uniref:Uncharacterized protein n=1 Tax=Cinara cedri TaxID=506608 RepID=A0A5E4M3G6_9HEMI|nr:Protein of unknown function DUF1759 [Cinara cedri]